MISLPWRKGAIAALRLLLTPAAFYLALFTLLTYPLMLQFSTCLFADKGDGLQNYWNLWWINKSVVELHQPFWKTPYLHYPYGTSLIGHTLNPFNGFLAIPLHFVMSPLQAHNAVVVFSFVAGGVTAFLLAYYVTHSYWPSLMGGSIFTFSNFHFAHAEGHMQLVSLEWIPLFVLCWYMLLLKPRPLTAVAAALTLFLVALCDYYYLFYSALTACLMVAWYALRSRDVLFFATKRYRLPLAIFSAVALATSGLVAISLLLQNAADPLIGAHPSEELSLDLLAPLIPGGHWRFASLTSGYWSSLPGNIHESSVHMGISVLALVVYAVTNRRSARAFNIGMWCAILMFFLVLSLGPALRVWGRAVTPSILPYAWLEAALPPLALSGVPVRMMVMVMLGAAVLAAVGLKLLLGRARWWPVPALLAVLMAVEYLPKPLPASQLSAPAYVDVLKGLKDDKGVLDTVAGGALALYYQTIHEKPIAFGYIARVPKSVAYIDSQLSEVIRQKDYVKLQREFGIRYLVVDAAVDVPCSDPPAARLLYQDEKVKLYDLGP